MSAFDVLCVGDALIDMFVTIGENNEHMHLDEQKKEMCFVAGAKIPIDDCQFLPGGDANNVSVGLSRLGKHTALVGETGDDEFAQKIIANLQKEHVDTTYLKQTSNTQATFSINFTMMHDRTILSRHITREHNIAFEDAVCQLLYVTSLGEMWKPLYACAIQFAKEKNVPIAFNPGSHQLKEGVVSFSDMLSAATILFLNKEEAEDVVYGTETVEDTKKQPDVLLHALQQKGPKLVIMTDGENGSYVLDEKGQMYTQGIIPCNFIQKTGVGDAYTSAFLAAHVSGKDVQECMKWGAINASSVVEHLGAQTGLLTVEQMNSKTAQQ